MKMDTLMVLIATVGLFFSQVATAQKLQCKPDEYYSSFTHRCEQAVLRLGLGDQITSYTLSDLRAKFQIVELSVSENPSYELNGTDKTARKYRGVRLIDVITKLLPAGESLENYVLAATCLDGFNPVLEPDLLKHADWENAIIAFEQMDLMDSTPEISVDSKWELVKTTKGIVSPGPFFLVWDHVKGTYPQGWPYQLNSVQLINVPNYRTMIDLLFPNRAGLKKSDAFDVLDGFYKFHDKCLVCHQINGVGGKKASTDLMKIFGMASNPGDARDYLSSILKDPPPGMLEVKVMKINDSDIAHLVAYLQNMANRKY